MHYLCSRQMLTYFSVSCRDAPPFFDSANAHRLVVNQGSAGMQTLFLYGIYQHFIKKTAFFFGDSEKSFIFAPS